MSPAASAAQGAVVLAVIGGVFFLLGLAIALFGQQLPNRSAVAGACLLTGGLVLLILIVEILGGST